MRVSGCAHVCIGVEAASSFAALAIYQLKETQVPLPLSANIFVDTKGKQQIQIMTRQAMLYYN